MVCKWYLNKAVTEKKSCIFIFSFSCPWGIWRLPTQGWNLSWSCDLCHSYNNAGSLTHCARLGIELVPSQRETRSLTHCATAGTQLYLKNIYIYYFCLFMAALAAYGSSQARGRIRVVAAGLRHSHSNAKIWDRSVIYTIAHSNARFFNPLNEARDWTQVLMDTGWVRYYQATMGTPIFFFFFFFFLKARKSLETPKYSQNDRLGLSKFTFLQPKIYLDGHTCPKSGAVLMPSGPQIEKGTA